MSIKYCSERYQLALNVCLICFSNSPLSVHSYTHTHLYTSTCTQEWAETTFVCFMVFQVRRCVLHRFLSWKTQTPITPAWICVSVLEPTVAPSHVFPLQWSYHDFSDYFSLVCTESICSGYSAAEPESQTGEHCMLIKHPYNTELHLFFLSCTAA